MATANTRNNTRPGLWPTWNRHYRIALPPEPLTKERKLRIRQEVKRNWDKIGGKNRNEHLRLGRSLCGAINAARRSEEHAEEVERIFNKDQRQATLTPGQMAASAEDMYRALIQYLEDLLALVRIEDEIGEHVAVLRTFDGRDRMGQLIDQIEDAGQTVGGLRQAELALLGTNGAFDAFNTRRDAFLKQHFDQGPNNTFVPVHGGNNDSRIGLWIQSDASGRITDRVVVKDVCFDMIPDFWTDPRLWRNFDQPFGKELVEAYLMKKLQETGSVNVVRLRDSQLHVFELLFRMFIEYCPHGDANGIREHHIDAHKPVPEPLIWHLFESLVNAGLVMEEYDASSPPTEQREVVHMDIKPQNVFVGLHPDPVPSRDNWAAFPTFKLGDYGLAFETWPTHAGNPHHYNDTGTDGYRAPEQTKTQFTRLNAKTNVFGVGITVMTMMSRDRQPGLKDGWKAAIAGSAADEDYPFLSDASKSAYSEKLLELVAWCVNYNPQDRPSFQELRDAINTYTQGDGGLPEDDLADGMRKRTDVRLSYIGLKAERWAIGRDMDNLDEEEDDQATNDYEEYDDGQEPTRTEKAPDNNEGPKDVEKPKVGGRRIIDEDYDF